ncbi:MAG TPA: bacillithiol biosynthesis deacetylase BshB1 [bacterium]|jgi:bacillithiol biosynthesis deacetylase BshB1|nr:bacillithiol biosynthesis deacetylase BshB1 [bacterium]
MKRQIQTFETVAPGGATNNGAKVDVLAFGAHPDDVEIAMGGTILSLKAQGAKVVICHLTDGEPTPYGNHKTRLKEAEKASRVLKLDDYLILPLKNRELQDTMGARKKVAEVMRKYRPAIVFAPYWVDAHPDHWGASQLVEAARFWAKLVKTDMKHDPWYPPKFYYHLCSHLRPNVQPSFIVDTSAHHEQKLKAVACYESQFIKKPGSKALDFINKVNRYFGGMIGVETGEPFFSKENLGVKDPRSFV